MPTDALEGDVYLDGGLLIRRALDADLVDEMTLTFPPILLGDGIRLFDGLCKRHKLAFTAHHSYGPKALQITAQLGPGQATSFRRTAC